MPEEVQNPPEEPRKRYAILAQDDAYNGTHPAGARFMEGVAYTDDPKIAEEYDALGFHVEVDRGVRPVRLCEAAKAAKAKEKSK